MTRLTMIAAASLLALAAAGCDRPPSANALDEGNLTAETNLAAPVENLTAPPPVNATVEAPPAAPPPTFTQDEQMRDDADATGMTARLPDEAPPGGNETQPAE